MSRAHDTPLGHGLGSRFSTSRRAVGRPDSSLRAFLGRRPKHPGPAAWIPPSMALPGDTTD